MHEKFFTDLFTEDESDVIVIGLPSGPSGQEYLKSIRKASWFVEIFDIYKKKNLFQKKIADAGDVKDRSSLEQKLREIFTKEKIPIVITKGDIASYHACKILKDVKVISFDAHTDLLDEYTDEKIQWIDGFFDKRVNSATWLRRTAEIVGEENICVVGLRSINEDLVNYLHERKIFHFTPRDIRKNLPRIKEIIAAFTKNSKIYLNVDMDFFDPSIAPSVDYPEPEGLYFSEFQEIFSSFGGKIVGATICGGNPSNNQVTEFLTVRTIFELLSKI